jgi:hypothetical protein
MGKDYRINTSDKTYFHHYKQWEQKIFRVTNRLKFHQCEDQST